MKTFKEIVEIFETTGEETIKWYRKNGATIVKAGSFVVKNY